MQTQSHCIQVNHLLNYFYETEFEFGPTEQFRVQEFFLFFTSILSRIQYKLIIRTLEFFICKVFFSSFFFNCFFFLFLNSRICASPNVNINKVKKVKENRRQLGFNPITFSENSNYGRESLLETQRQNIAGCCQQTPL